MRILLVDDHLFDLKGVVSEFNLRMISPPIVFILDQNGNETSQESPESVRARLRAYADYKKYDIASSCLVAEYLISPSYRETLTTRFSNNKNFDELPRQVYFTMVLIACNTSASIDVESATSRFKELSLRNFPGEDVSLFIILALKYIKIIQGAH